MGKIRTMFYRGKLIESIHNIKCHVGSFNGKKLFTTNNDNDYIYPRSSIKIFQAIYISRPSACHHLIQCHILIVL